MDLTKGTFLPTCPEVVVAYAFLQRFFSEEVLPVEDYSPPPPRPVRKQRTVVMMYPVGAYPAPSLMACERKAPELYKPARIKR